MRGTLTAKLFKLFYPIFAYIVLIVFIVFYQENLIMHNSRKENFFKIR